ncbi:MAG: hypothetical protein WAN93_07780, partial [Solirubrobacteraceae bacterium]
MGTSKMRSISVLAMIVLSVSVIACGSEGKEAHSTSQVAATATDGTTATTAAPATIPGKPSVKNDRDHDSDNNDDDYGYGHAADAADRQAVTKLVTRYYAAAAAGDGATGCSLIYSLLAEEIPEVYGGPTGPPGIRGNTCAVVMSKMFKQDHRRLTLDHATLKVTAVRILDRRALATLSFKTMPQRDIAIRRERNVWKIGELLDTELG